MAALNMQKLAVDVLLREEEIAAELEAALSHRFLNEKFFYWLPPSVRAWVDLTRSTEYRNANRAIEVLKANAAALEKKWAGAQVLCSIGCGEGSKDRVLLEAFAAAGRLLKYVAADFSQALLELALIGGESITEVRQGVKLDVARAEHLQALAQDGTCIFAVLGNTLGAFDPQRFPKRIRRIMKQNDVALFDGEVFDESTTLAGYDNPTNRRFAFSPLAGLGLTQDDGELHFELQLGKAGIHEVVKYFVARRDLELRAGGKAVKLNAGEKILMSSSIKYDEKVFYSLLDAAGFKIEFSAKSSDGKFMLAGARG